MAELTLGADFPPVSVEEWRRLVDGVLTRGDPDADPAQADARFARLVTTNDDGLRIEPLYTATMPCPLPSTELPGVAPFTRGNHALGHRAHGWDIRQRVLATDDDAATARQIRDELARGTTSIVLDLTTRSRIDADVLGPALEGVFLDLVTVVLDAGTRWPAAADALREVWARRGLDRSPTKAVFGADPVGMWAATGGSADLGELTADAVRWAQQAASHHPGVTTFVVDAARLHECGSGDVDELAWSLALGVHDLRTLTAPGPIGAGLDVDTAAAQLEFRFAATPDQFSTIAKLRAARRLWHRVADVAGIADTRQRQHAVTSRASTARYDLWVNVLRNTVACFAAGVGGADAVTVAAHDELVVPGGSSTGRRLARNVHLVLTEETNVAKVADPAGGSWYVEHLTDQLARAAWAAFQDLERAGGVVEAVRDGVVQERLAKVRDARFDAVADRRHPLTGITEFPDVAETSPPEILALEIPSAEPSTAGAPRFPPLRPIRYADAFEAQRRRADAITERTGRRPEVYLVTLGPPAVHSARAMFAKNLFESGGIVAVAGSGAQDATAAADGFASSGAQLACICSSDKTYADLAVDVAHAVKVAGPRRLYLAARPSGLAVELAAAGVDRLLHAGGDVLAVISDALDALEEGGR
ncbi:MAG: methylmalonyl-CoA mutase family protein [Ilumatobacteraceae bacterium]